MKLARHTIRDMRSNAGRRLVVLATTLFVALTLLIILFGFVPAAEAAVTATALTSGGTDAPQSSYTTASITPSANKLVLLAVGRRGPGAISSVSGNGLTWVQIASQFNGYGDGDNGVVLFRAMKASPTTGAITITFASAQQRAGWSVVEFGNVDTSGTNGSGAIVQYATNSHTGSTTITATLGAFASTNNATYGASEGGNPPSAGTGFTQLHYQKTGTNWDRSELFTEWRTDNDTTVDVNLGYSAAAIIAVEIAQACSFQYRKSITVQSGQVSAGPHTDFPMLVNIASDTNLKTVANGGHVASYDAGTSDPRDILFRASDGTTQLDHEIEKYDATTGQLVAWVRVPSINNGTVIYMYYGNSCITSSTQRKNQVWNSNFKAVYHLPNGSTLTANDSTSNANNGTVNGSVTAASGLIDGAANFPLNNSYYVTASTTGVDTAAGAKNTVEFWMYWDGTTNSVPFDWGGNLYDLWITGSNQFGFNTENGDLLGVSSFTSSNVWVHVAAVFYNGVATPTQNKLYLNGAEQSISQLAGSPLSRTAGGTTRLSGIYSGSYAWGGKLDEVRISNVARSAGWILTEYNNQSAPATYVTVGAERPASPDYAYRRPITIPDSMTPAACGTNLTSFPILVSYTDATLKTVANGGHVQNTSGYDIVFWTADDTTQLDHEIEKYVATTGELVAWVRIPTLVYNAATTIYMYYGNSGITSPTANPTGVWNTSDGWRGVWHLSEATAANRLDSTADANTLTPSASQPTQVGGQIGSAANFAIASSQKLSRTDALQTGLDITGVMTVEAWINHTSVNNTMAVVSKWRGTGTVDPPYLLRSGSGTAGPPATNRPGFFVSPNSTTAATSVQGPTTSMLASTWYHIVGVYDGTNLRIYKNGAQETGSPNAYNLGSWNSDGDFFVGSRSTNTTFFDGIIDEVRVSATSRDACWVGTEYNSMASPATVGVETANAPTLVEMVSLEATEVPGRGVLVSWRTGFEVDNLGFHVYREVNGDRVRVTPSLVAGSALFAGAGTPLTAGRSYAWWDRSPVAGAVYWLEEWELSGERRWHGPVQVQPGVWQAQAQGLATAPSPLLAGLGQPVSPSPPQGVRRKLRQSLALAEERRAVQWGLASRPAVKLLVSEEGWYRVSQEELAAAGLDPGVDPGSLQLYVDGQQVPILVDVKQQGVFASGDGIEFYGEGLDTASTAVRVYWLVVGSGEGLRIREAVGGGRWAPGPASFPYEVERADRTLYFPALLNGDEGNFFGAVVTSTPAAQTVRVQHVDRSGPGELVVRLQGGTAGAHRVGVELNGVRVGTVVWEGMVAGELAVPVGGHMIFEGDNQVVLVAEGGEGDVSAVESIRVRYAHTWQADGEGLKFSLGGYQEVTIGGFRSSQVRVLDITDPGAVHALPVEVAKDGEAYQARVGVPEPGTRTLLAVGTGTVRHPVGVLANRPTAWHAATGGADLLIIAHRALLSAVEPLRALRESQGLKVAVVDVESVYDEFSFGAKSPQAIKDLLACAKDTWSRPPRYLLLVGDASYDPRSYLGYGYLDLLPTRLVDTKYLETASDDWFADFDGDGIGDIPVGRLPVQTAWEAATVVGKIVAYDGSAKLGRVLLVADANDEDNDFEGLSGAIKAVLPSTVWAVEVYRGQLGDGAAKLQLMNGIDLGQTLINYVGHGTVDAWGGYWVTAGEARALGNDRYGLVVSMTCLSGFFQDPFEASLAEAFLEARAGGAVAVWASSGLTESKDQLPIDEALVRLLFSGTPITLGDATIAAKTATKDMDIRRTWILFGDPTTRLRR